MYRERYSSFKSISHNIFQIRNTLIKLSNTIGNIIEEIEENEAQTSTTLELKTLTEILKKNLADVEDSRKDIVLFGKKARRPYNKLIKESQRLVGSLNDLAEDESLKTKSLSLYAHEGEKALGLVEQGVSLREIEINYVKSYINLLGVLTEYSESIIELSYAELDLPEYAPIFTSSD